MVFSLSCSIYLSLSCYLYFSFCVLSVQPCKLFVSGNYQAGMSCLLYRISFPLFFFSFIKTFGIPITFFPLKMETYTSTAEISVSFFIFRLLALKKKGQNRVEPFLLYIHIYTQKGSSVWLLLLCSPVLVFFSFLSFSAIIISSPVFLSHEWYWFVFFMLALFLFECYRNFVSACSIRYCIFFDYDTMLQTSLS
jgi:hypothetical protein